MKILITGANGQLGLTLQDVFAGSDLILTDRDELDITDAKTVNNFIDTKKPEVVINAAAYTAVDQAEIEKELARKINVDGAKNLAAAAKKVDAIFFHVSTDFVFDGKKSKPYVETDETNPLSYYGQTKLESEKTVAEVGGKYFILRTAWLYSPFGKNFVKTIAKLGSEKEELKVVSDQIGCPTYAYDLAIAMKMLLDKTEYGLYHFAGDGKCSWFDFAQEIVKLSGGKAKVLPQTSFEYAASRGETLTAERPKYSPLNCKKIQKLDVKTVPWQESLAKCIEILKENQGL
ncbi:MAG: dTDP-4-dehydrorhamnose reductase [Candidatus Berkelbacteria bacterium]|nr:dTDP-4-dehydrorhamnose reductase [Candidatus Berkelbacteria bacterium]